MVQFVKIISRDEPFLERIGLTFVDAFPYTERRDMDDMVDLITHNPRYTMWAILSDGEYAGFLTFWTFSDFIYAEHFGIEKDLRNKGIGGEAFFKFLSEAPLPVVGEVETPVDDLTRRRVELYKGMGMRFYDHPYYHPPFHAHGEKIDVCMVSYGDIDLEKEFPRIEKHLYKYVYPKVGEYACVGCL